VIQLIITLEFLSVLAFKDNFDTALQRFRLFS
jgi:hypothetical protein